jgi:hypothetical protein
MRRRYSIGARQRCLVYVDPGSNTIIHGRPDVHQLRGCHPSPSSAALLYSSRLVVNILLVVAK